MQESSRRVTQLSRTGILSPGEPFGRGRRQSAGLSLCVPPVGRRGHDADPLRCGSGRATLDVTPGPDQVVLFGPDRPIPEDGGCSEADRGIDHDLEKRHDLRRGGHAASGRELCGGGGLDQARRQTYGRTGGRGPCDRGQPRHRGGHRRQAWRSGASGRPCLLQYQERKRSVSRSCATILSYPIVPRRWRGFAQSRAARLPRLRP